MNKMVILKPRLSEKAYAMSEELNTYLFEVPASFNRLTIAEAITSQYEVSVESVRIASQPGKTKRSYRRRGRVTHRIQTPKISKAYVRLKEGEKLPIFSAVEEAQKAEASTKAQSKGSK